MLDALASDASAIAYDPAKAGMSPDRIGRYRIINKIGQGGMGVVYAAHDERLGRSVALKLILDEAADAHARNRLWREARIAASINHPNVCHLYEIEEDNGQLFLAMELLQGESLAVRIARGSLTVTEAVEIELAVLSALGELHRRGLVHRDLKPSNVFLTPHGPKLLDFGLARQFEAAVGDFRTGVTVNGRVAGTPAYMAPEQWQDQPIDGRADLFSAGVMLYEMVTGKRPFEGHSPIDIFHAVMFDHPTLPTGAPSLVAIKAILQRALHKHAVDRYQSAEAMAKALSSVVASKSPRTQALAAEPDFPPTPYPLLQPYAHPRTFAGRDSEIAKLLQLVRQPTLTLCLHAPSGAGKSSLLLAGLAPRLRDEGFPVYVDRHPGEPGLARRILATLDTEVADADFDDARPDLFGDFARRIARAHTMSGKPAVLILDQMDDFLRQSGGSDDTLARLGPLLAATARALPGVGEFPCRWVLCYRHEFHGEVVEWLQDVLGPARRQGRPGLDALPFDLSSPDRMQSWAVPVMGTPVPGDTRANAGRSAFLHAIQKPLEVRGPDQRRRYAIQFAADGAERLADAFLRARVAQPRAALLPELQVVLNHLLESAPLIDGDLVVDVPQDAAHLDRAIDDALAAHLGRALEEAFPLGRNPADARVGRARALLVLRELADVQGRRGDGLTAQELAKVFGRDGAAVIRKLESPRLRLIVQEERAQRLVYALSHDRLAEVVTRFFESEGARGALELDARVMELRGFVLRRSDLLLSSNDPDAINLTPEQHDLIERAADALLREPSQRSWWRAASGWFHLKQRLGEDPPAIAALIELATHGDDDWRVLGKRLHTAEINPALFWTGVSQIEGANGAVDQAALLDLIEYVYPALLESREAFYAMSYALDEIVCRHPAHGDRVSALHRALRDAFGRAHGHDAHIPRFRTDAGYLPDEPFLGFVEIPGGPFLMGSDRTKDAAAKDDNEIWPASEGRSDSRGILELPPFYIARYPVTVAQFRAFADSVGLKAEALQSRQGPAHHPVVGVSWQEALQYCAWLESTLTRWSSSAPLAPLLSEGWHVNLPSEAQWEKAARGTDGRIYPWGDAITPAHANYVDSKIGATTSVGSFPNGASSYGLLDMSGNVWEWTRSMYRPYPYDPTDGREDLNGEGTRVVRGGSYGSFKGDVRTAFRFHLDPRGRVGSFGFRVGIFRS